MRIDLFLPFLKKAKKNAPPPSDGVLLRLAKRVLPAKLFADRITGKPGIARQLLKRLGPTWLSSPVRRVVQVVFFVLFLWLFFYVAWPYSARPEQQWKNVAVSAFDADNRITCSAESVTDLRVGDVVHATDAAGQVVGPLQVTAHDAQAITLTATSEIPNEKLEELRFDAGGPWTLGETPPGTWPSHYADSLQSKEWIHAETLLVLDPLVAISTALAAKTWVWSLIFAGGILLAAVFIPRGFCGYLCPLGTLIDLFDWSIASHVTRFRVRDDGWWVHIKYYLLLGVLLCSLAGVLVSGYVAAIPVLTRGMLFLFEPLQTAASRGVHNVPAMNAGHFVSLALFFGVLALGFLKPRFWCKYVCPSGAVFSLGNLFRVTERKVESSCIHCNKCIEICPFDAIKPDITTRATDCTQCQSCGGVCPTQAIKFVDRWNLVDLKLYEDPPTHETSLGRRGFMSLAAGTLGAVVGAGAMTGATKLFGAHLSDPAAPLPVRPPGSVPEREFLEMCIRCGECFKACPNNVLQPLGFQQGLEGLWTPAVVADWAGCESSCNACGQVCPTGAIRALPLVEKKVARMGLAIVDLDICLPHAGREACQLCVDECVHAGYNAIEFTRVGTEVDDTGLPIEGSGFLAPVVQADKCVGCGLCQTRCYGINVAEKHLLTESAIIIEAGAGKEDRLMRGSYRDLRAAEATAKAEALQTSRPADGNYLPDFLRDK
ncbi:MAG TPA: 4Fe-4S binding protein [Pirellulaceae bacterium]|nr:4Fe-4S binding protein [Pirellulaceae bacterium]